MAMLAIAIGWEVYQITRNPLALGLVGLVQFIPNLLFFLIAGAAADRYSRRLVLAGCYALQTLCAVALLVILGSDARAFPLVLAVMFLVGTGRTFSLPTGQAMTPNLVPVAHLNNAITWMSAGHELATIIGPVIGGLLLILGVRCCPDRRRAAVYHQLRAHAVYSVARAGHYPRAGYVKFFACRITLYLAAPDYSWLHVAGSVCSHVGRRYGDATYLCCGYSRRR